MRITLLVLMVLFAGGLLPAFGQSNAEKIDARDAYVSSNIVSIFYHELGHAIIDKMSVPIFGQEEDAADVLSILMIDQIYDEEPAQDIAYDAALGFLADAEQAEELAFWGVHGIDEQRFYNLICLFYGANPADRIFFAEDLGLPEERADSCPEEYDQAILSWGGVLDQMLALKGKIIFEGPVESLIGQVVAEEIAFLNRQLGFPFDFAVLIETCEEANAFYDPETGSVTLCAEFETYLSRQYENM